MRSRWQFCVTVRRSASLGPSVALDLEPCILLGCINFTRQPTTDVTADNVASNVFGAHVCLSSVADVCREAWLPTVSAPVSAASSLCYFVWAIGSEMADPISHSYSSPPSLFLSLQCKHTLCKVLWTNLPPKNSQIPQLLLLLQLLLFACVGFLGLCNSIFHYVPRQLFWKCGCV